MVRTEMIKSACNKLDLAQQHLYSPKLPRHLYIAFIVFPHFKTAQLAILKRQGCEKS